MTQFGCICEVTSHESRAKMQTSRIVFVNLYVELASREPEPSAKQSVINI